MEESQLERLKESARQVAARAHTPHSHYPVGAALLTSGGQIYTGCNVESSSFGLTVCAERNAISAAVAAGATVCVALVVFSTNGATPCGACRQVIWDICGEIEIYICDAQGGTTRMRTSDLLPHPFDGKKLKDIQSV